MVIFHCRCHYAWTASHLLSHACTSAPSWGLRLRCLWVLHQSRGRLARCAQIDSSRNAREDTSLGIIQHNIPRRYLHSEMCEGSTRLYQGWRDHLAWNSSHARLCASRWRMVCHCWHSTQIRLRVDFWADSRWRSTMLFWFLLGFVTVVTVTGDLWDVTGGIWWEYQGMVFVIIFIFPLPSWIFRGRKLCEWWIEYWIVSRFWWKDNAISHV